VTERFLSGHALFADRATLESEIRRLGLGLALDSEIRDALRPGAVAGRAVGNRLVVQPMEGCDGTPEGKPDELTFRRWGRFARGGAKVLWGEAVAVRADGRANPRQLLLTRESAPDLARLVDFAREEHRKALGTSDDFLVGIQLTHSGRFSHGRPVVVFHERAFDAATGIAPDHPLLSDDDLDRLQDDYVAAARLAVDAGADFVDLKQCHRYLLSELLAARTRTGKFGGSLENRTRFARDLLGRIRAEVGPEPILATRINAFDGIPFRKDPRTGVGQPVPVDTPYLGAFGVDPRHPTEPDPREPIEAIASMREAGLQWVNVSAGCPYTNPHVGRPADTEPPDGYGMPESGLAGVARHFGLAEAVQRAFPDLPVVGTGYSYLRHFAIEAGEANLRAGRVAFVGLGRGAIAYPDFARDAASGGMARAKACITASFCTTLMRSKGNALGQFATGCVPRDPVYAELLREVRGRGFAGP